MNGYLNELFREMGDYLYSARQSISTFEFWLYPILTVLFIWCLTLVFTKVFYQNKNVYAYKKTYYIHHAWIISSLIAATVLISLIIILLVKYLYNTMDNDLRLSHLISLLIAFISAIVAFARLRTYYKQYNIREITKLPLTNLDETTTVLTAKKSFSRIKIWLLAPAVGFLFLLLLLKFQGNTFSVVFDNSVSVSEEVMRDQANSLVQTFNKMGDKNTVFLTLLRNTAVLNYEDIIQLDLEDVDALNATTLQSTPFNCSSMLANMTASEGTPLTEAVWQNFLTVENAVKNSQINRNRIRKLIIITDCNEDIMGTDPNDLFAIQRFNDIFPMQKVVIIDLADGDNSDHSFYDVMVNQLGVESVSGQDPASLYSALQLVLPESNLNLVIWILIVYLLAMLIILLIKPAKLR